MRNILLWMLIYTFMLAFSQIMLKAGLTQIGSFSARTIKDFFIYTLHFLLNPYIVSGLSLLFASFILWIIILSWFKLSLVFPLTALAYVFIAALSYFMLHERLLLHNYIGIGLIAVGIFFLLFKQV